MGTRTGRWFLRAVLLAAVASAVLCGSADAATGPQWIKDFPPDDWVPGYTAGSVHAAMGPDADVLTDYESPGTNATGGFRAAGGQFQGDAFTIASAPDTFGVSVNGDVGPGGIAVAAHRFADSGKTKVVAELRAADGTWTRSDLSGLFGDANTTQPNPMVDVSSGSGAAIVAWIEPGSPAKVMASRRLPGAATFQPALEVGDARGLDTAQPPATTPRVAIDPAGDAVVVWANSNDQGGVAVSRLKAGDSAWSAPFKPVNEFATLDVGPTQNLQVVMSDAGAASIYREHAGTPIDNEWPLAAANPGPANQIDGSATQGVLASAGATPYVAYRQLGVSGGPSARPDRVVVKRATDSQATPATIVADVEDPGPDPDPALGVGATGRLIVARHRSDGTYAKAGTLAQLAGAGSTQLSTEHPAARIFAGADRDGDGVVLLPVTQAAFDLDYAAAFYDGAGPRLRTVTVPASGRIGSPLRFTVAPFEPISSLGATSWSFGDGATATGTNVTHTYLRGGRFTVRVTSRDTNGNATTATRTVVVPTPAKIPAGTGGSGGGKSRPPADIKAPVLSRLRITRSLRPRRRGKIKLTLSEDAVVRVLIQRRRGRRWKTVATKRVKLKSGRRTIRFRAPRKAGRYRIRIRATDAAGNRGKLRTLRLKVRKPKKRR